MRSSKKTVVLLLVFCLLAGCASAGDKPEQSGMSGAGSATSAPVFTPTEVPGAGETATSSPTAEPTATAAPTSTSAPTSTPVPTKATEITQEPGPTVTGAAVSADGFVRVEKDLHVRQISYANKSWNEDDINANGQLFPGTYVEVGGEKPYYVGK
ncbi:MAG: hypothetical protein J6Z46_09160, partial [Lachnospiraceae bacterium]|nr:hypothetical protein [Lachnospiraceae bacterium]